MPRIQASISREREQHAYRLFKADRGAKIAAVNDTLYAKDGFRMNLKKLCDIRKAALANKPYPTKEK